jgi:hypothetical protein
MLIGIANKSSVVSDDQTKQMAAAIDYQLRYHVAPKWSRLPWTVYFSGKNSFVPGASILNLVDNIPEAPDAMGYHSENSDGSFFGNIGVKTVPGTVLTGRDSVSTVVSHEAIELYGDATVNRWADSDGGMSYPVELCDAVQSGFYAINGVSVSNFLLPAWFDNFKTSPAQFDYLNTLSAPFTLAPQGYTVVRNQGTGETQVWGEKPPWKNTVRTSLRVRSREEAKV